MAAITFKKAYIEPIVAGDKTSTLRAREPRYGVGALVQAFCGWGDPPFATLRVVDVRPIARSQITADVAHQDGFSTRRELLDALDDLYPAARTFWLIRFEVVDADGM